MINLFFREDTKKQRMIVQEVQLPLDLNLSRFSAFAFCSKIIV